jgi:two-component system sensor histidine kinase ChvG
MDARAGERRGRARNGTGDRRRAWRPLANRLSRNLGTAVFSSLTRRIVVLNMFALIALLSGILYLNQFRAGLIDARLESLNTQAEIIAAAVSSSATVDTDQITLDAEQLLREDQPEKPEAAPDDSLASFDFPLNPERVAPVLRRLVSPTKTRVRIYDRDGYLLIDTKALYRRGDFNPPTAPPPPEEEEVEEAPSWSTWLLGKIAALFGGAKLPLYREVGYASGKDYPEVAQSLTGAPMSIVRRTGKDELIVSVAVPIQKGRTVVGSLLLSTQGGDIDAIVRGERLAIIRVFLVAAGVTILLSILLAGTIAGPMRRLAAGADRVRRSIKAREEIPDFSGRQDEIGHLSRALRDMTNALYNRLDAIEHFAADVAHELKNPLTSLRSAVETLPLARNDTSRARLMEIIQHDVKRLDRLISDISDASRLDAELAREDAKPVDVVRLAEAVIAIQRELASRRGQTVALTIEPPEGRDRSAFVVLGHDIRLGQVLTNLLDNARSFSADGAEVRVTIGRDEDAVEILVDDDGPGIRAEQVDRIFERFYTDRPDGEGFGNNSGLGLAISRQIVEAHGGTIAAENRPGEEPGAFEGARFLVRLPAA